MAKYVMEVTCYAEVKTRVVVDARSLDEALNLAESIDVNPEVIDKVTSADGQPIEGLGDLDWKYSEMSPESIAAGGGLSATLVKVLGGETE